VHVYQDGSVHLNHGGTEMGQGLFVKVQQVVAQELGVPMASIRVSASDTSKVPNASPTAASSGSDINGMAARNAARTLRERLAAYAARKFDCDAEIVEFRDGVVHAGPKTLPFAEFARMAYFARVQLSATGFYATPKIHYDRKTLTGRPFFYFAYGAAVTEVAIDTLTGEHRMLAIDILHDAGKSLNPAIDRGQIEGGFIQGMGWLTTEELWWHDKGRLRTHAPSTYKIPLASDRPKIFNVTLADWPEAPRTRYHFLAHRNNLQALPAELVLHDDPLDRRLGSAGARMLRRRGSRRRSPRGPPAAHLEHGRTQVHGNAGMADP
jgi:xanthine dehydrogenase large subunit